MKKILFLAFLIIGVTTYSQTLIEYPYGSKFGTVQSRDTMVIGDIPLITDNTYPLVARPDGTIGYYGQAPTLTCNLNTYLVEMGTSVTVIVSGNIINNIDAILTPQGIVDSYYGVGIQYTISQSNSYSENITNDFQPTELTYSSNTYTVTLDWSKGSNSGTITCSKTINGVYPVIYGVSTTDYSGSTTGMYAALTTWVTAEGDKSIHYVGTGYLYYCIPTTWNDSDMSMILDHNGFDVTGTFLKVPANLTVISSGLVNNWTQTYIMYQSLTQKIGIDYDSYHFQQ